MWKLDQVPERAALRKIAQSEEVSHVLRRIAWAEPGPHPEVPATHLGADEEIRRALLLETHQGLSNLLEEQQSVLSTGGFCQTIVAAVARMPCAQKLLFKDSNTHSEYLPARNLFGPNIDIWSAVSRLALSHRPALPWSYTGWCGPTIYASPAR